MSVKSFYNIMQAFMKPDNVHIIHIDHTQYVQALRVQPANISSSIHMITFAQLHIHKFSTLC